MTLKKELQINITISSFIERISSYSSDYDYIFLDNLKSSSYSNLFRDDLKNLKIKDVKGNELKLLYIDEYSSQPAVILARISAKRISANTKLLLDVYDKSTVFSSTLSTGGEVLMFDANSDTYSDFFMNYSGLSIIDDSQDGGKFLRARYAPSMDGSSPSSLITTFASNQLLINNRVTVVRFKRIGGNITTNDNVTYHGTTSGSIMMQANYNLTPYQMDIKTTSFSWTADDKDYMLFSGSKTLIQSSSYDAYYEGDDYKQYHLHGRVADGFSDASDFLEGFSRNNQTKFYTDNFAEVEIAPSWYSSSDFDEFNYADIKWMLIFPSPVLANNPIPKLTVTERTGKSGIRIYKGKHEYPKAYKGSKLLWDADDESMQDTGLHLPDKIINRDWDWVF